MDVIDQQILQSLMLDGRAPMRRIAAAVGISEQTAARRYRAMREAGAVRVLAGPAATSGGGRLWVLRMQCRPDAAATLGERLAARDDVGWVTLVSGGAEILCTSTLPADAACGVGVLPKLSHTAAVLSFAAHSVLRSYSGGPAEWRAFDQPLTPEAERVLLDDVPRRRTSDHAAIAPEDHSLVDALRTDGRASISALARILGWPASRVSSRLQHLLETGAITVDVDVLLEQFGFGTSAYLFLQVAPHRIAAVCETLSAHPNTSWVAAITGSANVMAAVTFRTTNDLFAYVTEQAGPLDGVIHLEILPVRTRLKQADTRIENARLKRTELVA